MSNLGYNQGKPTALDEASITAQNTFSDGVKVYGDFNISISGTFVATVWVQRSFDGTNWLDVESFTAGTQKRGFESERDVRYRIGVKTGGFTSGTVTVRVSQ